MECFAVVLTKDGPPWRLYTTHSAAQGVATAKRKQGHQWANAHVVRYVPETQVGESVTEALKDTMKIERKKKERHNPTPAEVWIKAKQS